MKKYKAILFDLDGTLLNTSIGVKFSTCYTIDKLGWKKLEDEAIERFVGPPIQDSFIREYGVTPEEAQEAANVFRAHYKDEGLLQAELYEGIIECLAALKKAGYKIAVATYKRHDYAIKILEHFGIADYCDSMNGADNNNVLTKADIVEKCMEEVGVTDRKEAILIGDSEYDGIGAENAGVDFIGVTYGFGFRKKDDVNQHPNIGCACKPLEILEILECSN